jgi:hypothetical protein
MCRDAFASAIGPLCPGPAGHSELHGRGGVISAIRLPSNGLVASSTESVAGWREEIQRLEKQPTLFGSIYGGYAADRDEQPLRQRDLHDHSGWRFFGKVFGEETVDFGEIGDVAD